MKVYIVQDEDGEVVKVFETFDKVKDWAENLDPNAQYFSLSDGILSYRTNAGYYYVFPMPLE